VGSDSKNGVRHQRALSPRLSMMMMMMIGVLTYSVRAAQHPPPLTVPPLPWWAVDLSGVTSRFHRPRSTPAADTVWPMVGWEFLLVKVFGRTLLQQKRLP